MEDSILRVRCCVSSLVSDPNLLSEARIPELVHTNNRLLSSLSVQMRSVRVYQVRVCPMSSGVPKTHPDRHRLIG